MTVVVPSPDSPQPDPPPPPSTLLFPHRADRRHPEAERPCGLVVQRQERPFGVRYRARCDTHDCGPGRGYRSAVEAEAMMRCDRGRQWTFLVLHLDNHEAPEAVDLPTAWEYAHELGMAEHGGDGTCCADLAFFRIDHFTVENEALTLRLDETPGGFRVDLFAEGMAGRRGARPGYDADGVTYLYEDVLVARAGDRPAGV